MSTSKALLTRLAGAVASGGLMALAGSLHPSWAAAWIASISWTWDAVWGMAARVSLLRRSGIPVRTPGSPGA